MSKPRPSKLFLILVALTALSSCVDVNRPYAIVKRQFIFYPDYANGDWQEKPCADDWSRCVDVTYTVAVSGCGDVTFTWRVYPEQDTFDYRGAVPNIDDSKYYAIYAFRDEYGNLQPSPSALGKPLPATCMLK